MRYVDKFGRITRKETCNLCQVGPFQAYRIVSRMVQKGLLIVKGQKKARYYERRTQNNGAPLSNNSACK